MSRAWLSVNSRLGIGLLDEADGGFARARMHGRRVGSSNQLRRVEERRRRPRRHRSVIMRSFFSRRRDGVNPETIETI